MNVRTEDRSIDLFKEYKDCRIGCIITSLDETFRKTLELYSSPIGDRIEALKSLKREGVSTYCSVEPIFPVPEADPIAIIEELRDFVDLFEFGKWTQHIKDVIPARYKENYSVSYYVDLFSRITDYCDDNDIPYCTSLHSKDLLEDTDLPFKPYPTVK
jgi:hypothetical protein